MSDAVVMECPHCGKATHTRPTLPAALVCILSVSPIVYGLVLIPRPWCPFLQEIPMQPVHQILAGIALVWIGVDFIRSVWSRPGSLAEQSDPAVHAPLNSIASVTSARERSAHDDPSLT